MADRGANVTGNTFFLIRNNSKTAEPGINVHKRSKRAHKPAPYSSTVPKVQAVSYNAGKNQIYNPFVIKLYTKRLPII